MDASVRLRTSCEGCSQSRRLCEATPDGGCVRCAARGMECVRAPSRKRGPKGPWGPRRAQGRKAAADRAETGGAKGAGGGGAGGRGGGADPGQPARGPSAASSASLASLDGTLSSSSSLADHADANSLALLPLRAPHRQPPPDLTLPDMDTFWLCCTQFFLPRTMPHTTIVDHRELLRPDSTPMLVLCSVLLATIAVARQEVPDTVVALEAALFERAKGEIMSLLDGGQRPRVEAFAALANLNLWTFHKGLHGLGRKINDLADFLLVRGGYVREDMRSADPPSWAEHLAATRGPGIWDAALSPGELAALRSDWRAYYTRQRLVHFRLFWKWIRKEWARERDGLGMDLEVLRLPAIPPPAVWEAAEQPGFDPRWGSPPMPVVAESLGFLVLDPADPARPAMLAALTPQLTAGREVLVWLRLVLRREVDRFLVSCREAGLASPAELPSDPSSPAALALPPPLAQLLRHRAALDATILQIRDAYPPAARRLAEDGDPTDFFALHTASMGSPAMAHTEVPRFLMILLLRLELYTSLGAILGEDPERTAEALSTGRRALLAEFAAGGVYSDLLAHALAYTKLFEHLLRLSPIVNQFSAYTSLFSVCCLHATFASAIRSTLPPHPSPSHAALAEVERGAEVCIRAFELLGRVGPVGPAMAALARKMLRGERIGGGEVGGPMHLADAAAAEQGGEDVGVRGARELEGLLAVYQRFADL